MTYCLGWLQYGRTPTSFRGFSSGPSRLQVAASRGTLGSTDRSGEQGQFVEAGRVRSGDSNEYFVCPKTWQMKTRRALQTIDGSGRRRVDKL
jgi:hypothetical protein